MGSLNCLNFLNNYADLLNNNTSISGVRPHPIFFSSPNCSDTVWPPLADEPFLNSPLPNPVPPQFGSLYVPGGWQVQLRNNDGLVSTIQGVNGLPVLLPEVTSTNFDGTNQTIFNDVQTATIFQPTQIPTDPQSPGFTVADYKFSMCNNKIVTIVGARHITSWQAGSPECDTFMNGYCAPVANLGCAPNSTQPAALPERFQSCVCLVEENCLREVYCEPGNTDPRCFNDDAFAQFIPVTCFGKLCSQEGYRFQRMQNQRCTVTLCQQIINIIGEDIVVRGGATIFCGNRNFPVTSVTPTPTPTPQPTTGVDLPSWAWVLIGLGAIVLFVAIPVAVIVYKRSFSNQKKKKPNKYDLKPKDSSHLMW